MIYFLITFSSSCRKDLAMIVVYMLDLLRSFLICPTQMQLQFRDIVSQFQSLSFIMNRLFFFSFIELYNMCLQLHLIGVSVPPIRWFGALASTSFSPLTFGIHFFLLLLNKRFWKYSV